MGDEPQLGPLRRPPEAARQSISADAVRVYLNQIARTKLLSAHDEVALAKQIEAGLLARSRLRQAPAAESPDPVTAQLRGDLRAIARDGERAKDHLLRANLRLVVSIAKHYTGHGMPLLDLIQEGNLGLIRSVEKFDYTKGFKFSTYATWWIRQAISRAMADQSRTIRLPVHAAELTNKLRRTDRELRRDLGRDPTADELARELDIRPERVLELQRHDRDPLSLEQPIGAEGDAQLGDFIDDSQAEVAFDTAAFTLLRGHLADVLNTLTEREANVIRLRYGLIDGHPCTLGEVGQIYGVSRERIRQIEAKTMTKLRHPARAQLLRDYLYD